MGNEPDEMRLKAIGTVRNTVRKAPGGGYNWRDVVSEIEIDSRLTDSLDGLEGFSHIIVIWWMHGVKADGELPAKIHPRGDPERPLTGRFATRSPQRPNPLGKATVRLLQRRGNILEVRGLDAIDGTPVIDIKPYLPGYDSPPNAKAPEWTRTR